ncbi:hypothetical protein ACFWY6_30360 [Streptomyces sp. NPDC059037]|uniref:hypothetical protein n=1 Tax=Streptomyces sp. NPDC059037 TaxID=3346710 RepID=UPI0036C7C026
MLENRAAHRLIYAAQCARRTGTVPLDENTAPQPLPVVGDAAVDTVLQRAVDDGVITEVEAELIGRTRMDSEVMAKAASAVGMSTRTAFRHRAAAERRLVAALNITDA